MEEYAAELFIDVVKLSNEQPDDVADDIENIIGPIEQRGIRMNNSFYNRVNGDFEFVNVNGREGRLLLNMTSPQDEYIVGRLLLNDTENIDMGRIGNLANIVNYMQTPFIKTFRDEYMNALQYIDQNVDRFNRVNNVRTGRDIKVDNRTYKSIYGSIKLKSVIYKPLGKYNTIEYKVKTNCVFDYMKDYHRIGLNQKKINDILGCEKDINEGFTYIEIFKIACKYNFDVNVMDVTGNIIDTHEANDEKRKCKKLEFIINGEHMYVIKQGNKKVCTSVIYIKNIEEIKGTFQQYITSDFKLFSELKNKYADENIQIDYTVNKVYYGTNQIHYDMNASNDLPLIEGKFRSIYHYIDSFYKLRGSLNNESIQYFKSINHIRNTNKYTDQNNTEQFDHNGSYASHLFKNCKYPIPSVNDHWEKYDGRTTKPYNFYYIKVEDTDDILCIHKKGCYVGYLLIELEISGIEFKILKMFNVSGCRQAHTDKFNKYQLRRYIGWLYKTTSTSSSKYENIKDDELDALKVKYEDELKERNNTITISKHNIKVTTGILVNLMIKDLTNIFLFRFNKSIMMKNKNVILNTIKTDSLGYISKKKLKTPTLCDDIGKFKNESHKIKPITKEFKTKKYANGTFNFKDKKPDTLKLKKLNNPEPTKDNILNFLKQKQSFGLYGGPGYGKSYSINKIIIPYLKENNKKYLLCGATKEACGDDHTINREFKNMSMNNLVTKFNKIDYIIIDEAGLLTQNMLQHIEYVKRNTTCNIILIGDEFQCPSVDSFGESYLIGFYCRQILDNNMIILKWHKHARYTKELDNVLNLIKKNFKNSRNIKKIVNNNFKFTNKSKTILNMAYTHKTCDKYINGTKSKTSSILFEQAIKKKGDKVCFTVHWMQGKTIDVKYTINDIDKMYYNPHVLYTAISRAKSIDQIRMIN
jgi:hypothetical protein